MINWILVEGLKGLGEFCNNVNLEIEGMTGSLIAVVSLDNF